MTEINPKLQLNVNAIGLAAIIDSAVVISSEIVNFHFNALSYADLNKPVEPVESVEALAWYTFRGP